jgi:integrase
VCLECRVIVALRKRRQFRFGPPDFPEELSTRLRAELFTSPPYPNLTFQSLRRTFATLMQGKGTPKDAQIQLRHRDILTSLNIYRQPIPESVKQSVEALDSELLKVLDEFGRESEVTIQ